jgi:hypothetical protein
MNQKKIVKDFELKDGNHCERFYCRQFITRVKLVKTSYNVFNVH